MPIDPTVAGAYWSAITDGAELPELPDDPVEAFLTLLTGTGDGDVESAFRRLVPVVKDPYPGIAVADRPEIEMACWAAEITGLIPFASSALQDYVLYLDTTADHRGNYRVYPFIEGTPAEEIASMEDALGWMTVVILYTRGKVTWKAVEKADDALPSAPEWMWSGSEIFCRLRDLPLPTAYRAWSNRGWPELDLDPPEEVSPDQPGAARIAMVTTTERLLRSPKVAIRDGAGEIADSHRQLLDHLQDLAASVAGQRPPALINQVAESDDPELADLARAWLTRFEEAGAVAGGDAADPSSILRTAITVAIDALVRAENLEVEENGRAPLIEELLLAAFEAPNPQKMLRQLRGALFRSDHVVDIYADDRTLDEVFKEALGG